jgi:hypothetical protein
MAKPEREAWWATLTDDQRNTFNAAWAASRSKAQGLDAPQARKKKVSAAFSGPRFSSPLLTFFSTLATYELQIFGAFFIISASVVVFLSRGEGSGCHWFVLGVVFSRSVGSSGGGAEVLIHSRRVFRSYPAPDRRDGVGSSRRRRHSIRDLALRRLPRRR